MRRMLFVTVYALFAANGILRADEAKAGADQVEKIRTLRSTLLNKMPALADLFDNEHNGVNTAGELVGGAFTTAVTGMNNRIAAESAEPAETQDKALIDSLTAKVARYQLAWSDRGQKVVPAYSQKMNALGVNYRSLATLVPDLTNLDQVWQRADCNRDIYIAVLTELNKRADEIKAEASAAIADWIQRSASDARSFQD